MTTVLFLLRHACHFLAVDVNSTQAGCLSLLPFGTLCSLSLPPPLGHMNLSCFSDIGGHSCYFEIHRLTIPSLLLPPLSSTQPYGRALPLNLLCCRCLSSMQCSLDGLGEWYVFWLLLKTSPLVGFLDSRNLFYPAFSLPVASLFCHGNSAMSVAQHGTFLSSFF